MRGKKAKQIRRECFGTGGRKVEPNKLRYVNEGGFSGFYLHLDQGFVVADAHKEIYRRPWIDVLDGEISALQPINTRGTLVNENINFRLYKDLKKEYRNNWYGTREMFLTA